jgi:hypothetical protein
MFKNIKTGFFALLISLLFELIVIAFFNEESFQLSFICFAFHSLNMILFILYAVLYVNPVKSRVSNFKKGLTISLVFSFLISIYFFSYHKWINPDLLLNKKKEYTELAISPQMMINAENQIKENPNYYNGKTAEDLIEMQQENINIFLQPSKVFPISLFGFLLIGMVFTAILSLLNFAINK